MYTTKGVGLGEVEVNLADLGVNTADERTLIRSIRAIREVDPKSVTINNRRLKCKVNTGQLKGDKLSSFMEKIHSKIHRICEHKAEVPGPGVQRRKSKQRYINTPVAVT